MIDFKEEINKYQPIIGIEDIEAAVSNEVKDMMDLLQYIAKQIPASKE